MPDSVFDGEWIDISVPLYTGMVHWPDNPPVEIGFTMQISKGDVCNVSKISMGSHTGTHMDAPLHFVAGGATIDQMPFTATLGRARVIAITDSHAVTAEELRTHEPQAGERLLFKTSNSVRCWQSSTFVEDFVSIAPDAAQYLAECKVRTVGVDYLSVGGYFSGGPETHRALLEGGVWIIEGLNLSNVEPGLYDLICLPLKSQGMEGGPARAILRPLPANA